jgi:flap endonuclease-1
MGVAIKELLPHSTTSIEQLQGKIIAVDAMNMLYQFITTIRQHDGTPLKDHNGNITSHLTGLFARVTKLLEKNIKLVFVFDGEMPELKLEERKRRDSLKTEALAQYQRAEDEKDIDSMKKYAGRSTRITKEILQESKDLLSALGIPIVQAPSEGEAQAAFMVIQGDCDYVASQDIDCMIYGAPKVVRNLSISQKRKKINALTYSSVLPEVIKLPLVLKELDISLDQLRALAILVGTDFNVSGIKGIGPKKGLSLVKKHKENFDALFEEVDFSDTFPVGWKAVFNTIKEMPTTKEYTLSWKTVDKEKVIDILVNQHDFSKERVLDRLEQLDAQKLKSQQTPLGKFF